MYLVSYYNHLNRFSLKQPSHSFPQSLRHAPKGLCLHYLVIPQTLIISQYLSIRPPVAFTMPSVAFTMPSVACHKPSKPPKKYSREYFLLWSVSASFHRGQELWD